MDIKYKPLRQCISCRKVRPKEDLLRFVKAPPAKAVFDGLQILQGRGIYVCPDTVCLNDAYRSKKARTALFRKQESVDEIIREVRETLLKEIEKDIIVCKKMGYLDDTRMGDGTIRQEDLVLLYGDDPSAEKVKMRTAARAGGGRCFSLPEGCGGCEQVHIVRHACPKAFRLAINLQKYEMLSSKGQTI